MIKATVELPEVLVPEQDAVIAAALASEQFDQDDIDVLDYMGMDASTISDLVVQVSEAGLFGTGTDGKPLEVRFWAVCDSDGIVEGGLVTIDLTQHYDSPRLASYFQDWKDLCHDREATGARIAHEFVENVAIAARQAVRRFTPEADQ